ncbi:hypothetical protein KP509_05G027700 [Ceratopteris richardii]|uniref:CID domain-containing protein n=1 Tax=Ceratopteris richardii TaxID=49495 RepID=A0A8T2UPB3_CERRI|nr:hypothetical protein KP509_05G027700 [Ceratopteris richardii]
MNSAFNDQILAEKLRKLNNSQQSIETLSHWCIFHRKKAHLVVETWDKQLRILPREQCIPFLYLANDILQNSRRRGGEFVMEFWKVLPGALKDVIEKGDEQAHHVVLRLVDIWDERKVFGIRNKTLREELLGTEPPIDISAHHFKSSNNTKLISTHIMQEKLISAYRSVQNAASEEAMVLGRCNVAATRIEGLEKEADEFSDKSILIRELQEQEDIVSQCIGQLETSESAKVLLISLLKEALKEQENKLELIRSQLQSAKAQVQHSGILRQQLMAHRSPSPAETTEQIPVMDNKLDMKTGSLTNLVTNESYRWPPLPQAEEMASFMDEFKSPGIATSAAAEVAAKLAASSSSAQVLASVLSSMVAEEASNIKTSSAPLEPPSSINFPEKRQRIEDESDFVRSSENGSSFMFSPENNSSFAQSSETSSSFIPSSDKSSSFAHQPPPPPPPGLHGSGPHFYSGSVQLYSSSPQRAQAHYPPLPPGPPQSTNASTQAFPYGIPPRPPPPLPPHPRIQGQVPLGTVSISGNQHTFNSSSYPPSRPPGISFFDQQSLPAAQLPRH